MRPVRIRDRITKGDELDTKFGDGLHHLVSALDKEHASLRAAYADGRTAAIIAKLEAGSVSPAEQRELADTLKGARERIKDIKSRKVAEDDPKEYWSRDALRISALRRVARYVKLGLTQVAAVHQVALDYDNPKPTEVKERAMQARFEEVTEAHRKASQALGVTEQRIINWLKKPKPGDPKMTKGRSAIHRKSPVGEKRAR